MNSLLQDVRYGVRMLFKHPMFTLVAVFTLALGIGANTAIFSIINGVILRPLSISEPERLASIWITPKDKRVEGYTSYVELNDWRVQSQSFEDIAAHRFTGYVLTGDGTPERLQGMRVTSNFFSLLRVKPFLGRDFLKEEEKVGSERVAIISYDLWQSRFGSDESLINRQINLHGLPHTVVGILPPGFRFELSSGDSSVWTTVAGDSTNLPERRARLFRAIGRLKQGATLEQAQKEMEIIGARLAQNYPETNADTTFYIVSAHEQVVGRDLRKALWLLLGAVGFILLIACTNIANLLLARATTRQKEIAIRTALGAGRWRIARQLLTESILLSLLAGAGGLLLASWGLSVMTTYITGNLPRMNEVGLDTRVLVFTLAVSLLTGVIFSLVPILKASQPNVNEVLKSGTKGAGGGSSIRFWRDSLVVIEVALCLILLVGAGLLIKSFVRLLQVNPGFEANNILTAQISLPRAKYPESEQRVVFIEQALERLKSLPGVESAAFAAAMPFSSSNIGGSFRIDNQPALEAGREPTASFRNVTNDYFQTMKIPLRSGRYFNKEDKRGGVGAVIISETLARLYFQNENPIGKHISQVSANQNEGDPQKWEIVGVVGDVKHSSLLNESRAELYLPYQQNSWTFGNFLIRTTVEPTGLTNAVREQLQAIDKDMPVTRIRLLEDSISDSVAQPRFYALLFGIFGTIGLVLALTGIYGVMSYTVTERTQEIGIRMALGASRFDVVRMVVRQGMTFAFFGVVIGLIGAYFLSQFMEKLLFGVNVIDLSIFVLVPVLLALFALLAYWIPAHRAAGVDPMIALRFE